MSLVATGGQRVNPVKMFEPLIDAAVHWLEIGLPVTHLKIVEHTESKAYELKGAFSILKQRYSTATVKSTPQFKYDLFISYAHENTDEVLFLLETLQQERSDLRIFLDRNKLNAGSAWQQEIYEALDDCNKVIAVYSPDYLASKVCKEEFNIALFRHRESEQGTLVPIYLNSANLPTYMKIMQFIDCREADRQKLQNASKAILEYME
jgi:hypothetical protein